MSERKGSGMVLGASGQEREACAGLPAIGWAAMMSLMRLERDEVSGHVM